MARVVLSVLLVLAVAPSAGLAYEEVAVKDGGTVTGVVRSAGTPPKPDTIVVTKNSDVCGEHKISEALVVGPDRGVKDSVVLIKGIVRGKKAAGDVTIDNSKCAFVGHVTAVGPGALQFSSTVSGGSPPYTYRWDFGDGTTSTESSPTHVYASSGTYVITLVVTDSGGHATTTRFSVAVAAAGSASTPWTWIGLGVFGGAVAGALVVLAAQRFRKKP